MKQLRNLWRATSGASAAEFALVLPILLFFLLGIVDVGRAMFEMNEAKKATQVGVRTAVVTKPVAPGLFTASYLNTVVGTNPALTQGDRIPRGALGLVTCTSTTCTCTTAPCPTLGTYDTAAWNVIVDRMQQIYAPIEDGQVRVRYSGSGLGYAGDPNGPDLSPDVTVAIENLQFRPISFFGLGTITLPGLQTSLTAEDLNGAVSN
ncbi:TadE/TadG family type IV pilus assembly protein [Sphingomicrobium sediminis]|uniref:Pilus assembly protein n=1 Tax=Sphingomicrobium sediminis TaxID=2950949 RepID=A0A9X2EI73_9SPHN|nr:TadE family protein [Sphingomicrobium sediminis]MCM8557961.1 pilus assembly protein [Sphingomicrobium sediminis]